MGWYKGNSGDKLHPVGLKNPNRFGIHDMHGNVDEWCHDASDSDFYSKPKATLPDPVRDYAYTGRMRRGGGYRDEASKCRSAQRFDYDNWAKRSTDLAFRPAFLFSPDTKRYYQYSASSAR